MNSESTPSAPPKVSVLVPIYNVERYLRQCINSLITQTLQDIEILLLDDGSTDDSARICAEYAESDARIRVIHKANSGYGATMNLGLKIARGEYIGIVESDDWVESDMFESLYTLAKEHDVQVVKSNYYRFTKDTEQKYMNNLPGCDANKVINPKIHSTVFYAAPSIWTGLYQRQFIIDNDIRFLESPGASFQDTGFAFKLLATAERVWLTTKAFVHYRFNNSDSSVHSSGKVFCIRDEWNEIERFMDRFPQEKKASVKLRNHARFTNYLWNLNRLQGDEKEAFRKYFWSEYKKAKKAGEVKQVRYSYADEIKYMEMLNPAPVKWFFVRLAYSISRIFVKRVVRDNKIVWKAFFGLIWWHGGALDTKRPMFWES